MKESLSTATKVLKRITLDDVYNALDVLKDQQSEDSRSLNQRIDIIGQRADSLGQRVDNLGQRVDNLSQKLDQKFDALSQKLDTQGQRIDTIMQMLIEISKQMPSQKNQ